MISSYKTRRTMPTEAQLHATGALTTVQLAVMVLSDGFTATAREAAEYELRLRTFVDRAAVVAAVNTVLDTDITVKH